MSDDITTETPATEPEPESEPTIGDEVGDKVDQAIAALRAELGPRIDALQDGLTALSARVDEIQAQ